MLGNNPQLWLRATLRDTGAQILEAVVSEEQSGELRKWHYQHEREAMLDIENQPLLPSELYDPSYFRRAPFGLEKPRLRKMGKLWWCSGRSRDVFRAAASGKDPHEAYAKCMEMLGFVVPLQLPKVEPPTMADVPESDRFGNVLNFQALP